MNKNSTANLTSFALENCENPTIKHVSQTFDVDSVVRRFYTRFKAEYSIFQTFIQGISTETERASYALLMLSRLMFLYFIQKKGFLDNDTNYLPNRLHMMREHNGKDTFHSFYRYFLLRLFHEGLGKQERSPELDQLLGKVPYLNGGLFDVHELERENADIQIPDEAFARIFAFFDEYRWHLDERPPRDDKEINPDVLGYIFEKYINQKQMGAYYTKEDITEYISKNTIIPFLFEAAQDKCEIAFKPGGPVWRLLREEPDRYIYEAVKKGVALPLPPEISAGLEDISKRTEWNKPAAEEYALPTETWRAVVARRKRYAEIRAELEAGEICSMNDLVTYNLNIRQFAQDVIENCEGPDLLRAFNTSIEQVTVLDPTCGSGAFLLAALNILEPLYEACLNRMGQTAGHYFILKSIILNNLYGVDIMEEAVEICKLRLLLKLIAQVERVEDIEALPSIDFNIRACNALVGFVNHDEVKQVGFEQWRESHQPFHWFVEFDKIMKDGGFDVIIGNPPYVEYSRIKKEYTLPPGMYATEPCGNLYALCMERFARLCNTSSACGLIVPLSIVCTSRMAPVRCVLYSAYPNLWFNNYDTIPGTLFSGIVQRNTIVLANQCTGERGGRVYTTRNQKWYASERASLFDLVPYMHISPQSANELVPKMSTRIELDILAKIHAQRFAITSYTQQCSNNMLEYKRRWSYFLLFADNIRGIMLADGSTRQQQDVKTLTLQANVDRYVLIALLNSGLFYFHYSVFSDFRHVNIADFDTFMFDYMKLAKSNAQKLRCLGKALMRSYTDNIEWRTCNYVRSIGECKVPFYKQGASKHIIDEIDTVLAGHYGLTDEELDFIINYDIKYRMGEGHVI